MKEGEPMKKYRALTGLTYPASKADVELRVAGKECKWRDVAVGEVVDDIPPVSIPWMLDLGKIEEVKEVSGGDLRVR
jgi:hypothetical protein